MTVSRGDGRSQYNSARQQLASRPPPRATSQKPSQNAKTERRDLPTALLAGATKAEAAATRRAKRKKERILSVLGEACLLVLCCRFACAWCKCMDDGEERARRQLLFLRQMLRDLCFKLRADV